VQVVIRVDAYYQTKEPTSQWYLFTFFVISLGLKNEQKRRWMRTK